MKPLKYILAIDQGTTGSRAFVFDTKARVVASAYQEFPQYFPQPGWVEHDAEEIWKSVCSVIRQAISSSGIQTSSIVSIGITNQRETTVLWDRQTGKTIGRAVVWQCRRSVDICQRLEARGHAAVFHQKTGLVLDPYFSGTKIKWMFDQDVVLRRRAREGRIAFGTIDSWLIWKLTGGRVHVTDPTNASRTLLYNIKTKQWDLDLLKMLKVPLPILPSVQPSGSFFGETISRVTVLPGGIPITAVLGDQQAALYGQGCFDPGSLKNTYGTGCFIVMNTGDQLVRSRKGLLTTIASDFYGQPVYALEGAVFVAGAVMQWLRDQLGILPQTAKSGDFIKGVKDTAGVYFVPAFTGLGVPYWDSGARGMIYGLTRGTNQKHVVRAALESMAYQTRDVIDVMNAETRQPIRELKVDGGASANKFLMQFQSDLLGVRVVRPQMVDTTVLGAALLAGVTVGVWTKPADIKFLQKGACVFKPCLSVANRNQLYRGWQEAVSRVRSRS